MSCPDCFTGSVHEGSPSGSMTTIHGLKTYVANPPDGITPKGLVVMIPDAFGLSFVNNRLLCDQYAKCGHFLVYLPDFMNGKDLSVEIIDLMETKIKKPASWFDTIFYKPWYILKIASIAIPWLFNTRRSVCKPRILNFFQALRTSPPPFTTTSLKIGAAGFCWGGYYTVQLAQDTPSTRVKRHEDQTTSQNALDPLIDCGFTAHPSFLSVPEDLEKVRLPLSVAIGDEDMAMKKKHIGVMKEVLEVKNRGDHEVVVLPGAKHGFAVRTDPTDELQNKYAEQAEEQAISWFSKWLA